MRILLIGGTGTISSAITRQLAASGHDLWLLNRGSRKNEVPSLVERDIKLFRGRTKQYVFISSASAYHKPAASHVITEGTVLANPYWQYSRDKIACEERLMREYAETGFPVTIVRPSHTYCERAVPVSVHGTKGCWQVLRRMLDGKPVIVQGDGSSQIRNVIYVCGVGVLRNKPAPLPSKTALTANVYWGVQYYAIRKRAKLLLKGEKQGEWCKCGASTTTYKSHSKERHFITH